MKTRSSVYLALSVILVTWGAVQTASAADLTSTTTETRRESGSKIPIGQSDAEVAGQEAIGAEVFGREGGYVHLFLLLEAQYTDNLYYTDSGEVSDYILSAAPGFWLAVPSNREQLVKLKTSPTSPGGLQMDRLKAESVRRVQSYLLFSPEFVNYTHEKDHNHVAYHADAWIQYNLDAGISLDLLDQFNNRHEINNNVGQRIDEYHDNLASFIVSYEPSEKLRLRMDYANYWLDFDDDANTFRDRTDNGVAAYLFYRFQPRTSVFAQYGFTDIRYGENSVFDSEVHSYYAGLDWDITGKSRGRVKAGYTKKDFDRKTFGSEEGFSVKLQTQHNFTPKQAATLGVYRNFTESTTEEAFAVLTTGVDFSFLHRINTKWSASLNALVYRDEYQGDFMVEGLRGEREDETFRIGPALSFEPRDWGKVRLDYYYSYRDSNFDVFDLENNTVSVSLEFAL